MLRSASVALAACALSVVLSACGSDDNDELLAGNISLNAAEDTATRVSVDFGGGPTTATIVTAPTMGDVTFSGSPLVLTYTPHANVSGFDTFTYQVSNGDKTSNLGTVVVSITAVDDPPAIQPTLAVDEDGSVTATLITDVEGDKFTSAIVTAPTHGTLTVDSANPAQFTYQPSPGFNGADSAEISATYTLVDGTSQTVKGTVAITVRAATPAGGVGTSMRTLQGQSARFETLANDGDATGDTAAVTILSGPSVGTATVNSDGSIQYTPTASFVGNTSLVYEVRDTAGRTSRATMSIDVGFPSGILYLSRPDVYTANELYFSDGARTVKVSAPLPAGESIESLGAASSAPVVFYRTQPSGSLYRVDLSQPGVAQQVDPTAPVTAQELAGVAFDKPSAAANAVALSPQLLQQFGGKVTLGPQAEDGSFAVVVARDLHMVNLRDTNQVIDVTNGRIAEKPTPIPNF